VREYDSAPGSEVWDWTPGESGAYLVEVWARTAGSVAPFEQVGSKGLDGVTVISMVFASNAADDGWVLESTEKSSRGGLVASRGTSVFVGDDPLNRQYRSILSFDTGVLPAGAVIRSAQLKVRYQALVGRKPFATHGALLVDVVRVGFSGKRTLQTADFQATADRLAAAVVRKIPAAGWYSAVIEGRDLNRAGMTQFRLRFTRDDDNDRNADFIAFYSGNAPKASRPVLQVDYYVP